MHIAFATVAVIFRLPELIGLLSRILFCVWPIGITVGTLVVYFDDVYMDPSVYICNTRSDIGESIRNLVLAIQIVICAATYVSGTVQLTTTGGSAAKNRILKRVMILMLANIITDIPWCVWTFTHVAMSTTGRVILFYLILIFYSLGGFANAVVYGLLGRHVRRIVAASRHTQVCGDIDGRRVGTPVAQLSVAFESDATVHAVEDICSTAREHAEIATQQVQAEKDHAQQTEVAGTATTTDWDLRTLTMTHHEFAEREARRLLLGCFEASPPGGD